MALEELLVEGDVLVGVDALARDHLHHPIDEQERIAVRKGRQDLHDIHHFLFSSSSTRFWRRRTSRSSSGSRGSAAESRSHSRWGMAGEPETVSPSARSSDTPLCAPTRTPSPRRRCPITPTCPARITPCPSSVDPLIPHWATSKESGPTRTLCATCTRLSI